ncbi:MULTISPECIES: winged helix-turn-helix domain-containing protein [unclassified Endozoicomonas]|uniref:winged helix-turn-helix domain-containing protein n=1 Tax=unclassified Endozoicomonas TaxID=2644528 RepID=UPI003BB48A3C
MFMLNGILSGKSQESVLLFILVRERGYGREIAEFFDLPVSQVQKQLIKLEDAGILVSKRIGKTLCFEFSPRYAFIAPLKELLKAVLKAYPEQLRSKLVMNRSRPRKSTKPTEYLRKRQTG